MIFGVSAGLISAPNIKFDRNTESETKLGPTLLPASLVAITMAHRNNFPESAFTQRAPTLLSSSFSLRILQIRKVPTARITKPGAKITISTTAARLCGRAGGLAD